MPKGAIIPVSGRIQSGLFKTIHWPICRAYARYLADKPANRHYQLLCSIQFWRVYRFWPDFASPRNFSEKLWSRMLYVRDPLLTLICDKLRVREYVTKKVGGECLIPLLWSGAEPEDIPFDDLPSQFVLKANHGSGYNIIVTERQKLDATAARRRLRTWLGENYCLDKFIGSEWGYKNIKPMVTIESFIGEKEKPPVDFKFYCFSGRVELLTMHFGRYEELKSITLNRDFERYRFGPEFKQDDLKYRQPNNYDTMVRLAEALAAGFGFIRVDLYDVGDKVYFGEFTPYPVGVSRFYSFDITTMDAMLGEKWTASIFGV